jgi:hypothetical protein
MNIIDTTGTESTVTVAGIVWTKTVYPSYRNYRTERFFVGQSFKDYWKIWDQGAPLPKVFIKPEAAMAFAAELVSEVAA